MSTRNLLNLALLIVVAALVAVLVFKPGKQPPPVTKLTDLTESAIHSIKITRPNSKQVVLEKHDNKWQMLSPYKMPADSYKANQIASLAEAKVTAHYPITSGEDLKPYGLDTPQLTVVFNDKDKLEFGSIESLKYQRYIRSGNTLNLIFDKYFSNISNPPAEFVEHALLPGEPVITRLDLPDLSLSMKGDQWQAQPSVKELSNDRVNELLDNWTSAHATDVRAYKPAGSAKQAKVYLKGEDQPLVFDILNENKQISLGRADLGLKFTFTREIGDGLLRLPPKIKPSPPASGDTGKSPAPAKH